MAHDPSGIPLSTSAMEEWLQLLAQMMQGTQEAQKAFATMSQSPGAMAGFQKWLDLFTPGIELPKAESQPEMMTSWLENWQKAMGVVPRARYLELLEKLDALERRVRDLEDMNRRLKALLEGREQQEETTQSLAKLWGQMAENSIKTQAAWMEAWTNSEPPGASEPSDNFDEEE
jgi:hypothetical protein